VVGSVRPAEGLDVNPNLGLSLTYIDFMINKLPIDVFQLQPDLTFGSGRHRKAGPVKRDNQNNVCEFVREILSARTNEPITLTERPDLTRRDIKAVDELWASPTRSYAVEHTLIESFPGQLANIETIKRFLLPVKERLAGRLPGRFALAVKAAETVEARLNYAEAHREIERLILEKAPGLSVGETVRLESTVVPFSMRLHFRFRGDSRLVLYSDIEGDPDDLRAERFRAAFDAKCPKLAAWAKDGRTSVLILEADDSYHSNTSHVLQATRTVLEGNSDPPDVIVLVETDAFPWAGWVLKEGAQFGDDVRPKSTSGYMYERGAVG
jgi:hypothetical protein